MQSSSLLLLLLQSLRSDMHGWEIEDCLRNCVVLIGSKVEWQLLTKLALDLELAIAYVR